METQSSTYEELGKVFLRGSRNDRMTFIALVDPSLNVFEREQRSTSVHHMGIAMFADARLFSALRPVSSELKTMCDTMPRPLEWENLSLLASANFKVDRDSILLWATGITCAGASQMPGCKGMMSCGSFLSHPDIERFLESNPNHLRVETRASMPPNRTEAYLHGGAGWMVFVSDESGNVDLWFVSVDVAPFCRPGDRGYVDPELVLELAEFYAGGDRSPGMFSSICELWESG
jgi:hypothetical protein